MRFCDDIVVKRVDAGGALAGQNIQKYDRLRQVQQKEGSASALVKMIAGASDELELLVERPTMKDLVLHKNGDKVGLKIDKDSDTLGLIIKARCDCFWIAGYQRKYQRIMS
eukprot:g9124.t1